MKPQAILTFIGFFTFYHLIAQTDNPIPEKIKPSGLIYELAEVTQIPKTTNALPWTRINMMREVPDQSGRLFVIDLRGVLWLLDEQFDPSPFLVLRQEITNPFITEPGKGTGFGAFAFHPQYGENGKLYTTHTELPNSAPADYVPNQATEIIMQWVLTEWTMDNPAENTFEGTQREILRLDYPGFLHGMQDIQFNPNATPEDPDFGNLYICLGDGGSSLNFMPDNIQTTTSYMGSILRIDPLGSNSPNGQYGIPDNNPFRTDSTALGEIFCFGFRNPHRICWDTDGDQLMLIGDIGEKNLEEVNIGVMGGNYGWGNREGTFLYDRDRGRDFVYGLPADDSLSQYIYPVAQYDHDEGLAIVGGYVYRGGNFPELFGHYIFGDIVNGRVFHIPVDQLALGAQAEIRELSFKDANGDRTTFLDETPGSRVDLRFGVDGTGEIYFLTKVDGKIWRMQSSISSSAEYDGQPNPLIMNPNPTASRVAIEWPGGLIQSYALTIFNISGQIVHSQQGKGNRIDLELNHLYNGIYYVQVESGNKRFCKKLIKM